MVADFLFVMWSSLCQAAAACAETPAIIYRPVNQTRMARHTAASGGQGVGGGRHGGRCGDGAEMEGGIIMVSYPKIDKY